MVQHACELLLLLPAELLHRHQAIVAAHPIMVLRRVEIFW
jgi:hypothetical protein